MNGTYITNDVLITHRLNAGLWIPAKAVVDVSRTRRSKYQATKPAKKKADAIANQGQPQTDPMKTGITKNRDQQKADPISLDFGKDFVQNMRFTWNPSDSYFIISEDKAELILTKHLAQVQAHQAWVTPFSIAMTLVVTLVTAEFKKVWSIEPHYIQAFFVLTTFGCIAWTCWALFHAVRSPTPTVEDVVFLMKNKDGDARKKGEAK